MSNQYFWERLAGTDLNLRAGDADRERAADRLRKSHGEGRLDLTEFQQRLEHCYEAKTLGELRDLVRDLPREAEAEPRRSAHQTWPWSSRLGPLVPIMIALLIVSTLSGGHGHDTFWLWVPIVFVVWRVSWSRRRRQWAGARRAADDWL